jgi:hypothetical protein
MARSNDICGMSAMKPSMESITEDMMDGRLRTVEVALAIELDSHS